MADEEYDQILRRSFSAALATGPLALSPVPNSDMVAMAGIWSGMMVAISRKNGHELNPGVAKKVALSVTTGVAAYWTGSKMFTWVLAKVPGIGTVTGTGINGILNGSYTLWLGLAFIDLFEKKDVDLTDVTFVTQFVSEAMKPRVGGEKVARVRAFFKRWATSRRATPPPKKARPAPPAKRRPAAAARGAPSRRELHPSAPEHRTSRGQESDRKPAAGQG